MSLRPVTDRFDIVAVRIPHEGAVVGGVVLRPNSGLVQHFGTCRLRGVEERSDGSAVLRSECNVGLAESVTGLPGAYPEVGPRRYAIADSLAALNDSSTAHRRQDRISIQLIQPDSMPAVVRIV